MRIHHISALALVLFATPGYAACDLYGNCYSSSGSRSYGGSTSTYGSNAGTGSQWNSTTNGSRSYGTDSRGNSWSYDRNSGTYQNYGTGETRYRGQRY